MPSFASKFAQEYPQASKSAVQFLEELSARYGESNARKVVQGMAADGITPESPTFVQAVRQRVEEAVGKPQRGGAIVPTEAGPRGLATRADDAVAPVIDVSPALPPGAKAPLSPVTPELMEDVAGQDTASRAKSRLGALAAGAAVAGGIGSLLANSSKDQAAEPPPDRQQGERSGAAAGDAPAKRPARFGVNVAPFKPEEMADDLKQQTADLAKGPQLKDRTPLDQEYEAARAEYVRDTNRLADEYKAERDAAKRGEIFERLVQAVGHLVAAHVGQKSGIPIGQLKFEGTDWAGERQARAADYSTSLQSAANRYAARKETLEQAGRSIDSYNAAQQQKFENSQAIVKQAMDALDRRNDTAWKQYQGSLGTEGLKLEAAKAEQSAADKQTELGILAGKVAAQAGKNAAQAKDNVNKLILKFNSAVTEAAKQKGTDASRAALSEAAELNRQIQDATTRPYIDPKVFDSEDPNDVVDQLMMRGANAPAPAPTAQPSEPSAAGRPQASDADIAAYRWMLANPGTPEAAQIREKLQRKGLFGGQTN